MWKGPYLLHQSIGKCYLHEVWKGLFLLQRQIGTSSIAEESQGKGAGGELCDEEEIYFDLIEHEEL